MKELRKKLLTHTQNEAKRRLHESNNRITNICSTLSQVLSPRDYKNIVRVTETSKDAEYQTRRRHLKEKSQQLKNEKQKRSQIVSSNGRTIMKPAVLNLTGKTIDKKYYFFVKLRTRFCSDTEIYTVYRNNNSHRITSVEILSKTIGMKRQDDLSKTQRTALK